MYYAMYYRGLFRPPVEDLFCKSKYRENIFNCLFVCFILGLSQSLFFAVRISLPGFTKSRIKRERELTAEGSNSLAGQESL